MSSTSIKLKSIAELICCKRVNLDLLLSLLDSGIDYLSVLKAYNTYYTPLEVEEIRNIDTIRKTEDKQARISSLFFFFKYRVDCNYLYEIVSKYVIIGTWIPQEKHYAILDEYEQTTGIKLPYGVVTDFYYYIGKGGVYRG